jgi:glycosyltransferase involved in cell wall biosynthesis
LQSIAAQTRKDFELVVIDDCSTNDTAAVIEEFKRENKEKIDLVYVRNERNLGFYGSLNTGLEHSRGKYLCFMADDDILLENHLERALQILEADENIALFSCDCFQIDENGKRSSNQSYLEDYARKENFVLFSGIKDFRYMLVYGAISFGASILRKSIVKDIGFLNVDYRIAGDVDFWLRIALSKHKIYFLKEALFMVRNHEDCITRKNITEFYRERINILEQIVIKYGYLFDKVDLGLLRKKISSEQLCLSITYFKKLDIKLGFKYFFKANFTSGFVAMDYISKRIKRKR